MITISQLTELLGWASVINIAYLCIATLALVFMRETIYSIHGKLLGMDKEELGPMYTGFLSNYKIATLVFMVSPYIALKIMGQ